MRPDVPPPHPDQHEHPEAHRGRHAERVEAPGAVGAGRLDALGVATAVRFGVLVLVRVRGRDIGTHLLWARDATAAVSLAAWRPAGPASMQGSPSLPQDQVK